MRNLEKLVGRDREHPAGSVPRTALMARAALAQFKAIKAGAMAADFARQIGEDQRVVAYLEKAAVGAGHTDDSAWAGGFRSDAVVAGFIELLKSRSVLARLLGDGMAVFPFRVPLAVTTADATAFTVGEGAATPLSSLQISGDALTESKAAGLVVVTERLLNAGGAALEGLISRSLRDAVASTIDSSFLTTLKTGLTPTTSSGTSAKHAAADLNVLLTAVATTGAERLFFLAAPDVANSAATLTSSSGAFVFPAMGPAGGEMAAVPTLVSNQLGTGELILVDASGLAGNIEDIRVEVSTDTSVEMADNPAQDSLTPTGASLVSLWQTHSVGFMARSFFGTLRARDSAVAIVDNIAWAETAT